MANSLAAQVNCSDVNERILVVIQLHGGNDGLNTAVPLNHYSTYANLRPSLALSNSGGYRSVINLDSTLPNNQQLGLHPDLGSFKSLYDSGKLTMIQNAGYANNNKSHFQAKDDWLTGSDSTVQHRDGWMANFLKHQYPGYPATYPNTMMPDPVGLEFGTSSVSLAFHRQEEAAMGLAMKGDPAGFYSLVSGVGGALPASTPNSHYGAKLRNLIEVQSKTSSYAQRIDQVYANGTNASSVTYPTTYHSFANYLGENHLSPQLKTVARLISGGIQTKIFWVRMTGYDTHINQVNQWDATIGAHAVLMYNLAEAVKAFQDDLAAQGLEDKVLTITFSEFGRRVAQNGSFGTDHGTYAPMFLFGKHVNPDIIGNNADLSNLTNNDLSVLEHDYRSVFATVLQDWIGADNQSLNSANLGAFSNQKLPLISNNEIAPSGCYITPLPVSLLGFEAHGQADGSVLCEWYTEREQNNKGFILERAKDGENFEELAEIAGAGNSNGIESYEWIDPQPLRGISWYRLKQIDMDGTVNIQPKVAVHMLETHDKLSHKAFPNPAQDHFQLELHSASDTSAVLQLANLTGQVVLEKRFDLSAGISRQRIEVNDLRSGVYLAQVNTAVGERLSFRLVKL
jgi:uncharacterized protein (DUF1501 family)